MSFKNKTVGLVTLLATVAILLILVSFTPLVPAARNGIQVVQTQPTVPVLPENLSRISWGAVVAGVILAIMVQLTFNLLGLSIGTTQVDPYDKDAPSVKILTSTAAIWIGISTIISLLVGGWIAARLAGIPDNVDGIIHGLMVWGIVTLLTIVFISSSMGRLVTGVGILFQRSLDLLGQVTGTLAQGAATVVQAGAGAAQSVAEKAVQATQDAVSSGADTVKKQLDEHPEVQKTLKQQTATRSGIEEEIQKLLGDAGIEQQQVTDTVDTAKNTVTDAAKSAAQQARQGDLKAASQTVIDALQNVLEVGRDATQQVDRDKVINLLTNRSKMNREQAAQALDGWEKKFHEARQQTDQVREQVSGQLDQARSKVQDAQAMVSDKVDEVKAQVSENAKEVADQARKALGKVALALFAALVIGAIAAGIGGVLGTPHELPKATVNTTSLILPNS